MKKIEGMKNNLETLKNEAQALLDNKDVAGAKAKMQEIKELKDAIELQEILDHEEKIVLENKSKEHVVDNKTKENANIIRAMLKKVTGKSLTEAENALLLPTTAEPTGSNGESYILPQDIRTIITKKMREYKSFRGVLGYMPVSALKGSFPVENFETLAGLVDFEDGTDGTDVTDIKFANVGFSLKEKAAFIKLSNTLLKLSDNSLITYISEIFARKAVVTENAMAVTALKLNKTPKAFANYKEIKASANVDIDPAAMAGMVYVTNQDGFNFLDQQVDGNDRPILQPNPTDPTKKMFGGYNVEVFSNTLLPTVLSKAPIFFGSLKDAVKFVDLDGAIAFATSKEAGFMSNTTVARLIEFVDVVQCDSSDKCYVYGEITIA